MALSSGPADSVQVIILATPTALTMTSLALTLPGENQRLPFIQVDTYLQHEKPIGGVCFAKEVDPFLLVRASLIR